MLLPLGLFFGPPAPLRSRNAVRSPRAMLSIEQLKAISGCTNIKPGAARVSSSPVVSRERSLPKELWVHALEYSWLIEVTDAKAVSRTLCRAARFALTRGRWAPVCKCVRATQALPWEDRNFNKQEHITDEVKALFCEAWKLAEPCLLAELAGSCRSSDMWTTLGLLLYAAEPVISCDAHGRVLESLAHMQSFIDPDFDWCVIDSWLSVDERDEYDGPYWPDPHRVMIE